jgi:uncharacterized protein
MEIEYEQPLHTRPKIMRKYRLLSHILGYALPFFIVDSIVVAGFLSGRLQAFESIKWIYLTNFVVLPVIFLGQMLWHSLNRRLRATSARKGIRNAECSIKVGCSLGLLAIFGYATLFEPYQLQVETVEIVSPKVSREVRILHLSDIQTIGVGRYEQHVFRQIRDLNPDLILHTGDLVQLQYRQKREQALRALATLFSQLHPRYGIYHVLGDTAPHTPDDIQLFDGLAGATMLIDAVQMVSDEQVRLHLFGLSVGKSHAGARELIAQWRQTCVPDEFTILLGHGPDYAADITDLDIDLCLAGHTHGGQIRLPFLGPLLTLTSLPRAWALGYHEINTIRLNVSAGIGSEHIDGVPPIRLNCPPTMTIFVVKPE